MGKIIESVEKNHDLTVFSVIGKIKQAEFREHVLNFLDGEPTMLALWDFTEGSVEEISSERLADGVREAKGYAESRKGGRTAFVFSKDREFGFGRMMQAYGDLEEFPFEIMVFRDVQAARQWLGVD